MEQGIKVSVFDSVPPEGMALTAIGNDFCEQAEIASERLVKLLNEEGEVAIMMGVPSAPNHAIRAECHKKVFEKYPKIKLVATGIDNDDIETAQKQAAAIMQANPNLKGWVACDAAGPIGVAQAITEAGKAGRRSPWLASITCPRCSKPSVMVSPTARRRPSRRCRATGRS